MSTEEYLSARCKQHYKRKDRWILHEFQNFGADYGLIIELKDEKYRLIAFSDSGYSPERILVHDLESSNHINTWIESFEPTNPNYKYDS